MLPTAFCATPCPPLLAAPRSLLEKFLLIPHCPARHLSGHVPPCPCRPALPRSHCPAMPYSVLPRPHCSSRHASTAPRPLLIPSRPVLPAACPAPPRSARPRPHPATARPGSLIPSCPVLHHFALSRPRRLAYQVLFRPAIAFPAITCPLSSRPTPLRPVRRMSHHSSSCCAQCSSYSVPFRPLLVSLCPTVTVSHATTSDVCFDNT